MTSFRNIMVAGVCALGLAGATIPANAAGIERPGAFHSGWGHGGAGWGHGGPGYGRGWGWRHDHGAAYLGAGALGLATGALIASSAYGSAPLYYGDACRTVSTHRNAYGELVRVVTERPC